MPAGARIQEAILAYPTFFQNYSGIVVQPGYLASSDSDRLRQEKGWMERQSLQITVDFSGTLNYYPDLTLLNAYPPHYEESARIIDDVLDKMLLLGAKNAIITLHRKPDNHWNDDRAHLEFVERVGDLCRRAALRGIIIHMQAHPKRWVHTTDKAASFIRETGAQNLRLAINTGHLDQMGENLETAITAAGDLLGAVLLCSSHHDQYGQWYDAHLPMHRGNVDLSALSSIADRDGILFILNGEYESLDDAYPDLAGLRREVPANGK